jgi:2-polyprenyl-6-methoxyphenol hydroxylase-like FAD-dependent oxidoreductase
MESSTESKHYSICIIGAGPVGLGLALMLVREIPTIEVHIYEKRDLV